MGLPGLGEEVQTSDVIKTSGAQRIAIRADNVVSYLMGDHLSSTTVTVSTGGAANA